LAPIPSASDRTATVVTNGVRNSVRKASFRLRMRNGVRPSGKRVWESTSLDSGAGRKVGFRRPPGAPCALTATDQRVAEHEPAIHAPVPAIGEGAVRSNGVAVSAYGCEGGIGVELDRTGVEGSGGPRHGDGVVVRRRSGDAQSENPAG